MNQDYVALALEKIDLADYYRNDGANPGRAAHEMQLANVYAQLAIAEQQRPVVFFYHPGETGDGEVSPVGWGRDQPRPGDIFLDTHADEVKVYYVHPYGMLGDEVVGHLSDMIIDAVRRVRKDAEAYQEEQE